MKSLISQLQHSGKIINAGVWPWRRVVALGVVGLSMWAFSGLPDDKTLLLLYSGKTILLFHFTRDLGAALAIAAIVAALLERLIHESLLRDVHQAIQQSITNSDVLLGAAELKIQDVFARRIESTRAHWEDRVTAAIRDQLSKKGELRIACIGGREFFRQDRPVAKLLLQAMKPACECRLKVLLSCPSSPWTHLRAKLGPFNSIASDIVNAGAFLKVLDDLSSGKQVETHCFSELPPTAFLVITEDLLFLEPYPFARVGVGEGPIGGITPMLLIESDSLAYGRWKGHFDEIWRNHSQPYHEHHPEELNSGSQKVFL